MREDEVGWLGLIGLVEGGDDQGEDSRVGMVRVNLR